MKLPIPAVFRIMKQWGNVPDDNMKKTFNMGIGFAMVVDKMDADGAVALLKKAGYRAFQIGHMEKGIEGVQYA